MMNLSEIYEYVRLIRVRWMIFLDTEGAHRRLLDLMQNDPSLAVRYASERGLWNYNGPGKKSAVEKYLEQDPSYKTGQVPTLAFYLNHIYRVGDRYAGYIIGLRPLHWQQQYREFNRLFTSKDGSLLLVTFPIWHEEPFRKWLKAESEEWYKAFIKNDLFFGAYTFEDWQEIKKIVNGQYFTVRGSDVGKLQKAINRHPHFAADGTLTPAFILRGTINMMVDSWAEYPDAQFLQSYYDTRGSAVPNENQVRTDSFLQHLKPLKFGAGQFMQFSSVDGKSQPGILCLIEEQAPGAWKAELHFPSSVELDTKKGVLVERTFWWIENDTRGNWLKQVPGVVVPTVTTALGEFTSAASNSA